ncbi:MAG: hypothetical protein JSS32_06280 [Verrucomicrobia bacterium]|nr:hypothetical protein [Verrucomicrobiota bacterium]
MAFPIKTYNFLIVENNHSEVHKIRPQLDAIARKVKWQWNIRLRYTYVRTGADALNALQGRAFNRINPTSDLPRPIYTRSTEYAIALVSDIQENELSGADIPNLSGNQKVCYAFQATKPVAPSVLLERGFIYQFKKDNLQHITHMIPTVLGLRQAAS